MIFPSQVFATSARHGRGVAALFQAIAEDLSAGLAAEEPRPPEGFFAGPGTPRASGRYVRLPASGGVHAARRKQQPSSCC